MDMQEAQRRAIEVLKGHGLRCAGPRVEILTHLIAAHRPVSAQELIEALSALDINEATVYRTLNTLTEAGISAPVESPGRKRLYEVHVDQDCRHGHVHFICKSCGDIRCLEALESPLLNPMMLSEGYQVEQQRLYLYGSCPLCPGIREGMAALHS